MLFLPKSIFLCVSQQFSSNLLRDYLSDNFLFLMIIVFFLLLHVAGGYHGKTIFLSKFKVLKRKKIPQQQSEVKPIIFVV